MTDDESWRRLQSWERVRWSRKHAGYDTAKDAALSLGMQPNTYAAYERRPDSSKHIKLESQAAIRFARKFKVRWEWLLTGDGTPFEQHDPGEHHYRRLKKRLDDATPEQRDAALEVLEQFFRLTGTNDR